MARQQLFLIGLFALASCAPTPTPTPPAIREVQDYGGKFVCDDGQTVKMRFVPFSATLEWQSETIDLTQQPVAKGFLYTGGGYTVRAGSVDVTWTDTKGVTRHCRDSRVK